VGARRADEIVYEEAGSREPLGLPPGRREQDNF